MNMHAMSSASFAVCVYVCVRVRGPARPVTGVPGAALDPPLASTWAAMEGLVEEGLVRSIGVSNVSVTKLQALLQSAKIKPAVNQVGSHQPLYLHLSDDKSICNRIHALHVCTFIHSYGGYRLRHTPTSGTTHCCRSALIMASI